MVGQSLPEGMFTIMAALITQEILEHPNPSVKIVVASCLTEVTKITAPEAPYDDDVMKDVFKRIVEIFAELDNMNDPSFQWRVSILDVFARVRCCVLMLDLDLNHLILDMFHHFFKTASTRHSEQVLNCMEIIMTLAIQESDDVHTELASCLLQNLTKEAQETLPASFGLANRVLGLCKDKLKLVLLELLKGTPIDDYINTVALLFQDASDVGETNIDAPGKDMAAEGKLSMKFVSDESPQETSKLERDVNRVRQDSNCPSGTPTTSISNDGALVGSVKSPNGPASSKHKKEMPFGDEQAKLSDQFISSDKEVPKPMIAKNEKLYDANSKKGHKLGSSIGSEITEQSKVVIDNKSLVSFEELSPETNDGDKKQPTETSNRATKDSSKPIDTKLVVAKSRRGQSPSANSPERRSVRKKHESNLESTKFDAIIDSEGRATRHLNKDDAKSLSIKADEGESGKKQHKTSMKLRKENDVSDKDNIEYISLREMVFPTKMDESKGQQEDSGGSKRKHLHEAEEGTPSKKNKMLDENLVGSRFKLWWSNDEMSRGRRAEGSSGQQMKEGKTGTPQSASDDKNPPNKSRHPEGVCSNNNTTNVDSTVTPSKLKGKGVEKDTQGKQG